MTNKLGYDKLLGVLGKKSNKNSHEQNCSFLACASIVDPYYSFYCNRIFFNLKLNRSFSLIVGEQFFKFTITIQCLVKSIANMFLQSFKIVHNFNILDIINKVRKKLDTVIKQFPSFGFLFNLKQFSHLHWEFVISQLSKLSLFPAVYDQ